MRHLLFLLSICLVTFQLSAQELVVEYPYNPNVENDSNIGVEDLMALLASFGMDFEVEELLVDEVYLSEWLQSLSLALIQQQNEIDSLGLILSELVEGDAVISPCQGENYISYHGYDYPVIEVGNQCWFAENLRSENYADGTEINNSTTPIVGINPSYLELNQPFIEHIVLGEQGHYYSLGVITNDLNICPAGWGVPSYGDWLELGMTVDVNLGGYFLKDSSQWNGIDEFGFKAVPSGVAYGDFQSPDGVQYYLSNCNSYPSDEDFYGEIENFMMSDFPDCLFAYEGGFLTCSELLTSFIDQLAIEYVFELDSAIYPPVDEEDLLLIHENPTSLFLGPDCNSLSDVLEYYGLNGGYNIWDLNRAVWWTSSPVLISDTVTFEYQFGEFDRSYVSLSTESTEIYGITNWARSGLPQNMQIRCIKD